MLLMTNRLYLGISRNHHRIFCSPLLKLVDFYAFLATMVTRPTSVVEDAVVQYKCYPVLLVRYVKRPDAGMIIYIRSAEVFVVFSQVTGQPTPISGPQYSTHPRTTRCWAESISQNSARSVKRCPSPVAPSRKATARQNRSSLVDRDSRNVAFAAKRTCQSRSVSQTKGLRVKCIRRTERC